MLYLCRSRFSFVLGAFLIALSIVFSVWTPFDLMMNERLEMRRGLPPFEWWTKPPDATLRIYVFNVTNSEKFLNGSDPKMRVEEVGPIVFRESWSHTDVVFNENSTMTYNVKRTPIYELSSNELDLDSVITLPNMALLGSASYLWKAPLFVRYGFRSLLLMLGAKPFVRLTVRDFLYNFTDPLLKFVHNYAPTLVPTDNMGILNNLYEGDGGDNVTAYVGKARGHALFSLIDRYNGQKGIPGYGDACKDEMTNASEAVMFNQYVSKEQDLKYYRKLLCRVVPLAYKEEVRRYGISAYKFVVSKEVFNRTHPAEDDCYKSDPPLFDGLSDLSNCLYSFPLAGSFPHFLFGDPKLRDQVLGLKPNGSVHHSYIIVEPTTGIPMEEKAMIQVNVNVRPLDGFDRVLSEKFGDTIVPMFWLEYSMMRLPTYVLSLVYFILIVKYLQWVLVGALFLFGSRSVRKCLSKRTVSERRSENEAFLMKNVEIRR